MKQKDLTKEGLRSRDWFYSYKTSSPGPDGNPVNILHDFYIPILRRSIRYDRVAGYFRSTSLAAASQGFSAFTASDGKMRLIVGADLEQDDVQAILEGDVQRMTDRLNEGLGSDNEWPKDVRDGVILLAWMVSHGYLEVRVAFRIHKETEEPIPFSSTDDGYVHEKWAIFVDTEGNRIYISGSLNESKTALSLNAENIDVHADWWSEIEKYRADDAENAFERIWNDQSPHLRVLTLPEAIKKRLIQISEHVSVPKEIDGTTAQLPTVEPPSAMERLRFALIQYAPTFPNGKYVGMETTPIEPWPHQEVVARRLIKTWPYSYLLCDEVGLGKTIEAGLAIRSLVLSGLAKRVLITPPASLTKQWQREMATKFFLPFARGLSGVNIRHEYIFPRSETVHSRNIYNPNLCIVSTGLLSKRERLKNLQRVHPFDIVLLDEAHYARRQNPASRENRRILPKYGQIYDTVRDHIRKKTHSLWLATATPMQLDWIEAFDLIHLTNRVGFFQNDPSLTWAYYSALASLVRGNYVDPQFWQIMRVSLLSLYQQDPFLRDFFEDSVIDGRIRLTVKMWLENGIIPRGPDQQHIIKLIFSASPLSRVMLRHTRSLLKIYKAHGQLRDNIANRILLKIPKITFSPLEQQAYDELEDYCTELKEQIETHTNGQYSQIRLGYYLSFLRLRFASSLHSIRETLRRRLEKVKLTLQFQQKIEEPELTDSELLEDEEWDEKIFEILLKDRTSEDLTWERNRLIEMLKTLNDLTETPSKVKELLKVFNERRLPGDRIKQTVIFSRFYDTLSDLIERLKSVDANLLIGIYSGKGGQFYDPRAKRLRGTDRDEIKHRFLRGEIDILFCTDAAAEGLNLQTADLLINFDLPWNPMKVEQRIGRIDRIGQKHRDIYVLNLCYQNSAEEIVYGRLLSRLNQAGYIVGRQQFSLLPVTDEEFRQLAMGELSSEDLENRAKERLQQQKERADRMEIQAKDLYDIYMRMGEREGRNLSPIHLEHIWTTLRDSNYLKDLGCTVSNDPEQPFMKLTGLDEVPDGTLITTDRRIYEQGLEDDQHRLHFATYGNPVFESLLNHFKEYDLPQCVEILTQKIESLDAEFHAFAAVCINDNGKREVRFLTSFQDLHGIQLDEEANIRDEDLSEIKQRFSVSIRSNNLLIDKIQKVEKENQRAGIAQEIFNVLIIKRQLEIYKIQGTEHDIFWDAVKDWDELIEEKSELQIPKLPVAILRIIQSYLPFQFKLPQIGDSVSLYLPIIHFEIAVDHACRIADTMKVKKSELTVEMVENRLEREKEKMKRDFQKLFE